MGSIAESLEELMKIDGALGCCLVNHCERMLLGRAARPNLPFDLTIAAAGNIETVAAATQAIEMLSAEEQLGDILVMLTTQTHIIRPSDKHKDIFIFIAFDADKVNLALARRKVLSIERALILDSQDA